MADLRMLRIPPSGHSAPPVSAFTVKTHSEDEPIVLVEGRAPWIVKTTLSPKISLSINRCKRDGRSDVFGPQR